MANSIDPKQEQRVWSRVMAAQTGSAAPCVRSLSEALRRACCEERCAAELYRRYAARGGEYASLLGGMAERAEQNAQTLLCVLQSVLCV